MSFLYTNIWGECSANCAWEWQSSVFREPFFLLNWYARTNVTTDKATLDWWAQRSTIRATSLGTGRELWRLPIADLLRSGPRFEEGVEDRWKAADPIILSPYDTVSLRLEGAWTDPPVVFDEDRRERIYFHLEGLRFMGDAKLWELVMRDFYKRWKLTGDDIAERIAWWLENAHPDFAPLADGIREGRWKTTPVARRS